MTRYYSLLIIWALLLAAPVQAQEVALPLLAESEVTALEIPEPIPIHVSDVLFERPEARASLLEFHTMREDDAPAEANLLAESYAVGDAETFKVFNFVTTERDEIEFTLRVVEPGFRIWVETSELQVIAPEELEALRQALGEETPENSFDPERGILALSQAIFGDPPDVRGDGRTDVLLLDVRDEYDPEEQPQFVAGFVDPSDLTDRGNRRDVLYLDLRPGLVRADGTRREISNLESTAAHEYQHLIHMNYDRQEMTFVNEGLSEWSEVLHGYPRRPMGYLNHSDTYNVGLLRWRPRGTPEVLGDYERAGLLTTYLSERLGSETTGGVTRDAATGTRGYRNAAGKGNTSFSSVLLDFHVANYVNNEAAGPGLGYQTPTFEQVRALPRNRTDGRTAAAYTGHASLQPGAVQYLEWQFVDEFSIEVDGPMPLRARAILYEDGIVSTESVPIGMEQTFFGTYDRVVIALVHTDPDADPLTAHFAANWTADQFFHPEMLVYDNDTAQHYVRGRGMELLTRFTNPFGASGFLAQVDLPVYFLNQFSNPDAPPPDAPRAFTFVIRDVDEEGAPGEELFTLTMDDPRAFWRVSGLHLRPLHLNLTDYADQLSNLPQTVYIGFRDVPEVEENQVAFPASHYGTENVSYVLRDGEWVRLWDFLIEREDAGDIAFDQMAIPVRATYFQPTDDPLVLQDDPLPAQVALSANAPNPFSTSSQIAFTLPRDMDIRLEVYDVLGRRMALLREGVQVAGEHPVILDARDWGSGVYFVTLTAEGERLSRSVVVVR